MPMQKGQKVRWNWGNGHGVGTVKEALIVSRKAKQDQKMRRTQMFNLNICQTFFQCF